MDQVHSLYSESLSDVSNSIFGDLCILVNSFRAQVSEDHFNLLATEMQEEMAKRELSSFSQEEMCKVSQLIEMFGDKKFLLYNLEHTFRNMSLPDLVALVEKLN